MRLWVPYVVLGLLVAILAARPVTAERITLRDGTELSATVHGKDAESVFIELPRAQVAAINGRPLPAPVAAGAIAPVFTGIDLTGAKHELATYRGKPLLLQFWATWCPHCGSDLALMKDLFARYQGKDMAILTISIDQDLAKLRAFVRDRRIAYPVIPVYEPAAPAEQSVLPDLYEMEGVPAYYLIDATGMIAKAISGSLVEAGNNLESDLKRLLAASPAPAKP